MPPTSIHVDRTFWRMSTLLLVITVVFLNIPAGFAWQPVGLSDGTDTNPLLRRLQWLPLWGLAAWMITQRMGVASLLLRRANPFLVGFYLWAAMSLAWSDQLVGSINRLIQLYAILMIAAAFCVASWGRYRFELVTLRVLLWLLVISLIMVVVVPRYAVHNDLGLQGEWAGITTHKNKLGLVFSVAMMLATFAYASRFISLTRFLASAALIGVIAMGCSSTTSIVLAVLTSAIVWLTIRSPLDADGKLPALAALGIILVGTPYLIATLLSAPPTMIDILTPVTDALGKDITFTGRSELWGLVLSEANRHPIIGRGYGSFWLGPGGPSQWISDLLNWIPYQSHNGYIDIYNQLGLIGLGLLLGFFVWHFRQIWQIWRHDRPTAALHLGLVIYAIISNITETSMFRPPSWIGSLLVFSSVVLSRTQLQLEFDAAMQRMQHADTAATTHRQET
ncbi:O-antigen ligase family protein [uncultured Abyssibacter sp.]|uniref:O-antigen ligase family protein n=1 Tax=uncultured Abyssibacter sp. TaxID=2320202 RepID=UPI0032B1C0E4